MKVVTDMSDQDPNDAVPRILENAPRGTYPAEITKCDIVAPENGKDKRIEVTVKITDPEGTYWPLKEYINIVSPKIKWRVDQFLMAVGVLTPTKRKASWDPDVQVGKKVTILVGHEPNTYTNPEGQTTTSMRPRVNAWLLKGAKAESGGGDDEPDKTMEEWGAAADEGDEDAIGHLTKLAEQANVDHESYGTWAEAAEAIAGELGDGEAEGTPDDSEEQDTTALGAAADDGDEQAQAMLTELANGLGIDPEVIETWAEVAAAIVEGGEQEQDEEEEEEEEGDDLALEILAEAADGGDTDAQEQLYEYLEGIGYSEDEVNAIDTWAEAVQLDPKADGSGDDAPDYASMTLPALKKAAKDCEVSDTGTKAEIVARLEAFNEDPFAS